MTQTLNQQGSHQPSIDRLQQVYDAGLIPAEKKPFLTDLRRSSGPFLAVDGGNVIFDGASQIASHGLGFNPGALFGAAQYLESWTNSLDTTDIVAVRSALVDLLRRKLGSQEFHAHFCASGAEAVESTLAYFFDERRNQAARRVLAFKGSFHGRMMVALASTWNPAKREPFAWPGFDSVFATYPEMMDSDDFLNARQPNDWKRLWTTPDAEAFHELLAARTISKDALLKREISALTEVREQLASGDVFVMLVEPMQCEGGDRYSTARFHQGLAYLSETYDVPLVYDEIQTGFGLGGEFYWHRMFGLRSSDGSVFFPNGLISAKKAQVGISLVRSPQGDAPKSCRACPEQISAASLVRGYIQASVVDQFSDHIGEIESVNRQRLAELCEAYPDHITRPRVKGLSFAFDLPKDSVQDFVNARFQHGLLYYPAGKRTARFRLNLGYRQHEFEIFWNQLNAAVAAAVSGDFDTARSIPVRPRDASHYFTFHERFIADKLGQRTGLLNTGPDEVMAFLKEQIADALPKIDVDLHVLTQETYADFRDRILQMQEDVYEPARRSEPEEFDALFASGAALSILAVERDEIIAMCFAGPLHLFTNQRGVTTDPHRDDAAVAYMLDLTVAERYRGKLGRSMKQALMMLAQRSGVTAIHGRNRDHLAAGMWAINLSLGSHATQYLVDDYPDQEAYRDCLYYRCPTVWPDPPIDLSSGIESPLGVAHIDNAFVQDSMPSLVNKMTLSNFVSARFLEQLEDVSQLFPKSLRHIYTAGGVSECVDKITKVLWVHRQPRTRLLTIAGSCFGRGSFLSRSLSGVTEFFDVKHLPRPDDESFFGTLDEQLQTDQLLGVFVEPLMRRSMQRIAEPVLAEIIDRCREHGVPVVFHESASMFYRYSTKAFTPSGVSGLQPDASIAYLGGQMALACCSEALFLDKPLLLISTWEGDAFSLAQFHRASELVQDDLPRYQATLADFHNRLTDLAPDAILHNGAGFIEGQLPAALEGLVRQVGCNRWVSCPSYSEMLRFLA